MALTDKAQIFEAWKRANDILVAFRPDPHHDGTASALALGEMLRKMGKRVEIAAPNFEAPRELSFLPGTTDIKPRLEHLQKFVIEVGLGKTPLKEWSYDITDDTLRIHLVPASGTWQPADVRAAPADYRFDLICTIGVLDLAALGSLFDEHTDFFYHTPIINIDHDPANEHYGQINHVDINATAVGEVLYNLIAEAGHHLMDEHVATCLLTGMIGKTRSFKTPNVTPKTLHIASELVAIGARREEIVHHLYRTRTVPVLRLWGRALARLKHDAATKLVWTLLSRQDFIAAGADATALPGVIDELIVNAPEARAALLLYEDPTALGADVIGLLHTERPLSALELAKPFGGAGTRDTVTIRFVDKTLIETEPAVTGALKKKLATVPL